MPPRAATNVDDSVVHAGTSRVDMLQYAGISEKPVWLYRLDLRPVSTMKPTC